MKTLFEPKSIAVVGAAREETKVGHVVVKNLIASGFEGRIYPVNPKADVILGLKCYASLTAIPDEIDLAIVVVPNVLVPKIMEEAGHKGVKSAIIITSGFKESGKEGAELERKVGEIGRKYGINILGPNCLGLINTHHNMNATFTRNYPKEGTISIMSQSGAICTTILDWASQNRIGFAKFISVGNKVDIDEADLLAYLRNDDYTKAIAMYIEGTDRGTEFMRQASLTTRSKPIIALKAGRTSSGAKAASSHTGALSGSDAVYDAAMDQAGIVRVKTIDQLFDLLLVFSNMPLPTGDKVAIVTNAGGLGVMAADAAADHGLTLASFSPETISKLKSRLPEQANFYNPVDVIGDADAARYEFAIKTVMEDENVSCIAVMLAPTDLVDIPATAKIIASFAGKTKIPIVTAFVGGKDCEAGIKILSEAGIPNYESPDRAMFALSGMVRYARIKNIRVESGPVLIKGDTKKVRELLDRVVAEGRTSLSEEEGKEIFRAYGIPVPGEGIAKTPEEAVEIANRLGYPVVMKIVSPDIFHKTDVGGVSINIKSPDEVRKQFDIILSRTRSIAPRARIIGISIQQMITGREVIVGMVRDPQFGPVITFGLGGIFVEILKDVSQRIAPLTPSDVNTMIQSIKAFPILTGARGKKPADIESLKDVVFRVAQIALDFPEISELEINPVIVGDEGKGCGAVDALVTIRRESR
ncbi:MAG: acetate--CoA ligase family protein [Methanomassiliicoccales archaeon]